MILTRYNLLHTSRKTGDLGRRDTSSSGRWWWISPGWQVEVSALVDISRDGKSWAPDSAWGANPKPYILPRQRTTNPNFKACGATHRNLLFHPMGTAPNKTKYLKCIVYERKVKLYHSSRSSCADNLNLQILQDHPLPGKCLERCNGKSHFLLHSLQNLLCPTSLVPLQKIMNSLFVLRASIKERPHQSPI